MWTFFWFCVVGFIIYSIAQNAAKKRRIAQDKALFLKNISSLSLRKVTITKQLVNVDHNIAIVIDEPNQKIIIATGQRIFTHRVFKFKDVVSAQIFQDGETITSTNRGSQVGGAIVGGLLLGGVGLLVGGLSGSKGSTKTISRIDLRITLDCLDDPTVDISLFHDISPASKRSKDYIKSIQHEITSADTTARHWLGILDVVIKRSQQTTTAPTQTSTTVPVSTRVSNVTDKIRALHELKKDGLLSDAEYEEQKKLVLARN